MDILLLIVGAVAVLAGIAGCFLPVLPGPPIAWVGLLLLHLSDYAQFSARFLIITAVVTLVIVLLDYVLPALTTKRFGGTKAGQRGATAGTILGIFLAPWVLSSAPSSVLFWVK